MKKKLIYPIIVSLFTFCATGLAESEQRVTAELIEAGSFTDFSISGMSEERTATVFEGEFQRFARTESDRWLPEGYQVHLAFTDIDMAGDIQPWRNRSHSHIRYIESIYPPRLEFTYTVTGPDGEVVIEDETRLQDMNYLFAPNHRFRRFDSFRYELSLLADWFQSDLRKQIREHAEQ